MCSEHYGVTDATCLPPEAPTRCSPTWSTPKTGAVEVWSRGERALAVMIDGQRVALFDLDHPEPRYLPFAQAPERALLADFDGDGNVDLWVRFGAETETLFDVEGTTPQSVAAPFALENGTVTQVLDIDSDGRDDLVVRNSATKTVLWSEGQAGFVVGPQMNGLYSALTLYDVDGEGQARLLMSRLDGVSPSRLNIAVWNVRDRVVARVMDRTYQTQPADSLSVLSGATGPILVLSTSGLYPLATLALSSTSLGELHDVEGLVQASPAQRLHLPALPEMMVVPARVAPFVTLWRADGSSRDWYDPDDSRRLIALPVHNRLLFERDHTLVLFPTSCAFDR